MGVGDQRTSALLDWYFEAVLLDPSTVAASVATENRTEHTEKRPEDRKGQSSAAEDPTKRKVDEPTPSVSSVNSVNSVFPPR